MLRCEKSIYDTRITDMCKEQVCVKCILSCYNGKERSWCRYLWHYLAFIRNNLTAIVIFITGNFIYLMEVSDMIVPLLASASISEKELSKHIIILH